MTELCELQFFLSYDVGEVVGKMLMIDRFKSSLCFQIWHLRC